MPNNSHNGSNTARDRSYSIPRNGGRISWFSTQVKFLSLVCLAFSLLSPPGYSQDGRRPRTGRPKPSVPDSGPVDSKVGKEDVEGFGSEYYLSSKLKTPVVLGEVHSASGDSQLVSELLQNNALTGPISGQLLLKLNESYPYTMSIAHEPWESPPHAPYLRTATNFSLEGNGEWHARAVLPTTSRTNSVWGSSGNIQTNLHRVRVVEYLGSLPDQRMWLRTWKHSAEKSSIDPDGKSHYLDVAKKKAWGGAERGLGTVVGDVIPSSLTGSDVDPLRELLLVCPTPRAILHDLLTQSGSLEAKEAESEGHFVLRGSFSGKPESIFTLDPEFSAFATRKEISKADTLEMTFHSASGKFVSYSIISGETALENGIFRQMEIGDAVRSIPRSLVIPGQRSFDLPFLLLGQDVATWGWLESVLEQDNDISYRIPCDHLVVMHPNGHEITTTRHWDVAGASVVLGGPFMADLAYGGLPPSPLVSKHLSPCKHFESIHKEGHIIESKSTVPLLRRFHQAAGAIESAGEIVPSLDAALNGAKYVSAAERKTQLFSAYFDQILVGDWGNDGQVEMMYQFALASSKFDMGHRMMERMVLEYPKSKQFLHRFLPGLRDSVRGNISGVLSGRTIIPWSLSTFDALKLLAEDYVLFAYLLPELLAAGVDSAGLPGDDRRRGAGSDDKELAYRLNELIPIIEDNPLLSPDAVINIRKFSMIAKNRAWRKWYSQLGNLLEGDSTIEDPNINVASNLIGAWQAMAPRGIYQGFGIYVAPSVEEGFDGFACAPAGKDGLGVESGRVVFHVGQTGQDSYSGKLFPGSDFEEEIAFEVKEGRYFSFSGGALEQKLIWGGTGGRDIAPSPWKLSRAIAGTYPEVTIRESNEETASTRNFFQQLSGNGALVTLEFSSQRGRERNIEQWSETLGLLVIDEISDQVGYGRILRGPEQSPGAFQVRFDSTAVLVVNDFVPEMAQSYDPQGVLGEIPLSIKSDHFGHRVLTGTIPSLNGIENVTIKIVHDQHTSGLSTTWLTPNRTDIITYKTLHPDHIRDYISGRYPIKAFDGSLVIGRWGGVRADGKSNLGIDVQSWREFTPDSGAKAVLKGQVHTAPVRPGKSQPDGSGATSTIVVTDNLGNTSQTPFFIPSAGGSFTFKFPLNEKAKGVQVDFLPIFRRDNPLIFLSDLRIEYKPNKEALK